MSQLEIEEKYEKEVTTMVQKAGTLLRSKYGLWFLGSITFADSALGLPITADPFMVAYIVANRSKAFLGVMVVVLASTLGGVVTYLLSAFFIDQLLAFFSPEATASFNQVVAAFDQGTFSLAFLGALSPIPYTIVAIVAGALKGSLLMFILGTLAGRIIRFGIVGYLTYYFGNRALDLAKENLTIITLVSVAAVCLYILYKIVL